MDAASREQSRAIDKMLADTDRAFDQAEKDLADRLKEEPDRAALDTMADQLDRLGDAYDATDDPIARRDYEQQMEVLLQALQENPLWVGNSEPSE